MGCASSKVASPAFESDVSSPGARPRPEAVAAGASPERGRAAQPYLERDVIETHAPTVHQPAPPVAAEPAVSVPPPSSPEVQRTVAQPRTVLVGASAGALDAPPTTSSQPEASVGDAASLSSPQPAALEESQQRAQQPQPSTLLPGPPIPMQQPSQFQGKLIEVRTAGPMPQ